MKYNVVIARNLSASFEYVEFCITLNYSCNIIFVKTPTLNCQLSSIGGFYQLLDMINISDNDIVLEIIYKCFELISYKPNMILLDVKNSYVIRIEEIFKDKIISKIPYRSTNESSMCMFIVNIKR